jgi:hypothetical protein
MSLLACFSQIFTAYTNSKKCSLFARTQVKNCQEGCYEGTACRERIVPTWIWKWDGLISNYRAAFFILVAGSRGRSTERCSEGCGYIDHGVIQWTTATAGIYITPHVISACFVSSFRFSVSSSPPSSVNTKTHSHIQRKPDFQVFSTLYYSYEITFSNLAWRRPYFSSSSNSVTIR